MTVYYFSQFYGLTRWLSGILTQPMGVSWGAGMAGRAKRALLAWLAVVGAQLGLSAGGLGSWFSKWISHWAFFCMEVGFERTVF